MTTACGDDSDTTTTVATTSASGETTTTVALVPLETTIPNAAPPADYAEFRAQPTACGAEQPAEATPQEFSEPADQGLDVGETVVATITTSCGDIVVELDPTIAPETVNSFVFLANSGYFDGTVSHRILPGFVIQAGDPTATGIGGPGYVVPDELPPADFAYSTGVLAMANAGPNTTGSQFFIMLGDSGLPPLYSAFGVVVDGFETLTRVQQIPLGPNPRGEVSVPLETVYIEKVVVTPAG